MIWKSLSGGGVFEFGDASEGIGDGADFLGIGRDVGSGIRGVGDGGGLAECVDDSGEPQAGIILELCAVSLGIDLMGEEVVCGCCRVRL